MLSFGMVRTQISIVRGQPLEIILLLLRFGADPNLVDQRGRPPLLYAIGWADHPMPLLRALLAAGADPNVRNFQGKTALAYARSVGIAKTKRAEIVKFLREQGAEE